jgi:hypothetical protein
MDWFLSLAGFGAGVVGGCSGLIFGHLLCASHMQCECMTLVVGAIAACLAIIAFRGFLTIAREFFVCAPLGFLSPFLFQSLILFLL